MDEQEQKKRISDEEIREEIKRARSAPKREQKRPRRRVLLFALVLALVLGGVGYASLHGFDGMDSLRRLFTYGKTKAGEDGRAELFHYNSDRTARCEPMGDGLLVVSTTRVLLLDKNGEELFSRTVSFQNPAIALGGRTAAAYDVGGKELYLFNARGLLRELTDECGDGVLAVSLNASDMLALTTLQSGCRSAVTVYDDAGGALFEFRSSERYVSDACILNDGRRLATVTLGEADGMLASILSFYAIDSETPLSSTTLGGTMVLSLESMGEKLAAIQSDRLTVFEADGSLSGSWRYDYPYLRGQSVGGKGFAALLLSRYRSGSVLRLVTVGEGGETLGSLDLRREVLDVSASGEYVAVLYDDSLTVYRSDLSEYATLDGTDYARRAVMRADGSVLLLGSSCAWRYAP